MDVRPRFHGGSEALYNYALLALEEPRGITLPDFGT